MRPGHLPLQALYQLILWTPLKPLVINRLLLKSSMLTFQPKEIIIHKVFLYDKQSAQAYRIANWLQKTLLVRLMCANSVLFKGPIQFRASSWSQTSWAFRTMPRRQQNYSEWRHRAYVYTNGHPHRPGQRELSRNPAYSRLSSPTLNLITVSCIPCSVLAKFTSVYRLRTRSSPRITRSINVDNITNNVASHLVF